jgi:hypothetical protein
MNTVKKFFVFIAVICVAFPTAVSAQFDPPENPVEQNNSNYSNNGNGSQGAEAPVEFEFQVGGSNNKSLNLNCSSGAPRNFSELMCYVTDTLLLLVPLLSVASLLYFFWGIVKFLRSAGDGDERSRAKNSLMWGTIALFVMVSLWGIVSYLSGDFFGDSFISIPVFPRF